MNSEHKYSFKFSNKHAFTYVVIISFSMYIISGCSSNSRIQKNNYSPSNVPLITQKVFSGKQDVVYAKAISVLQEQNYMVVLSDKSSGLINAERFTPTQLINDKIALDSTVTKEPSAGEVFLTILGIVLIVGIVFIIIDAAASEKKPDQNSSDGNDHHTEHQEHHEHQDETKVISSYKYIVSLQFTALADTATRVNISFTEIVIQNGTPTSQNVIHNNESARSIFSAIELKLPVDY